MYKALSVVLMTVGVVSACAGLWLLGSTDNPLDRSFLDIGGFLDMDTGDLSTVLFLLLSALLIYAAVSAWNGVMVRTYAALSIVFFIIGMVFFLPVLCIGGLMILDPDSFVISPLKPFGTSLILCILSFFAGGLFLGPGTKNKK